MLSILNQRHIKRAYLPRRSIRLIVDCAGKFSGIFFGYVAYYLVRKNFALAMPYLVEQGFSRGDLGFALSGIRLLMDFRNSSWVRYRIARIRAFSCPQV